MDTPITLFDAIEFYLRQEQRLRWAGLESLAQQPDWAESMLWAHAIEAAERLGRWRAAVRAPVAVQARPGNAAYPGC